MIPLLKSKYWLFAWVLPLFSPLNSAEPALPSRTELTSLMRRVTDYQIKNYGPEVPVDWKAGTFFTGVITASTVTGESYFHDVALAWSEKANWSVKGNALEADNICMAQIYLDLYAIHKDPRMIADIKTKAADYLVRKTVSRHEIYEWVPSNVQTPFNGRTLWWWADSLYMAPPVFTRLYLATGDARYLELMHRLYWDTVDFLYVPADKLFFRDARSFPIPPATTDPLFLRDARFFPTHTPSGKNVYWSRGNGWVYAGLVRILDTLPKDDPRRADYLKLFQDLTVGILKYQGEDGLWRTSLNEPSWYPEKESSGTSFFCYGLLAGVNRGWLPKEQALAPALQAWAGLQTCLSADGKLGYAQGVGDQPGPVAADHSIDYTQGAFLLAASELYKMVPAKP